MSLVDSHAHLSMEEFEKDRYQIIENSFQQGISSILCPSEISDPKNLEVTLDLIKKYENIIAAGGVHPHKAKYFNSNHAKKIQTLAASKKIHAVGEIGLDFHYNFSSPKDQIKTFRLQLNIAEDLGLPVIVHSRKSGNEVALAVEEEHFTCGGVLHCFTENWEFAKRMINHNFFISFSGILTFPNAHQIRESAKKIPLKKILVETDSPFLVPVPFRGKQKRNEPLFVKQIAKFLAELKRIDIEKLADVTTQNFESLFAFEIRKMRC